MKFFTLATCLLSVVFSAPATPSNYQMLVGAIDDFSLNSDYSYELIKIALGQQKALLNSFSIDSIAGNLTIYMPSDAGFLNLKIASLSENDLYTYLQC